AGAAGERTVTPDQPDPRAPLRIVLGVGEKGEDLRLRAVDDDRAPGLGHLRLPSLGVSVTVRGGKNPGGSAGVIPYPRGVARDERGGTPQSEAFSAWYSEAVFKAEPVGRGPVPGTPGIRPSRYRTCALSAGGRAR